MEKTVVFYQDGDLYIIDIIKAGTDKGFYFNNSLKSIKKQHPNAEIIPLNCAIKRINEASKSWEHYSLLY